MSVTEDFTLILEKEREAKLIPFLQSLNKAQKKELVPELKRLYKTYSEYKQDRLGNFGRKGSKAQIQILVAASFVCCNRKDFEQLNQFIDTKEIFDKHLPWYRPDWFSDHVNNFAGNDFMPLHINYDWYMTMVEQGYVTLSPAMIAKLLPNHLFSIRTVLNQTYLPQNLLTREATLTEHIWYFFDYESYIHGADKHFNLPTVPAEGIWTHAFKKHSDEGTIDRQRLLKETLRASNSNFSQTLSGWFIALFMHLEPSKAELLNLQDQLLQVLNSPHSKPVNTVVKYLKEICDEKNFNVDAFLDHAPLLLASESKTAISTTLMAIDKLAKKYKDKSGTLMAIACQAFIHQDNNVQVRVAKLLQKYGDATSDELRTAVSVYQDTLLFDARNLLTAFIDEQEAAQPAVDEAAAQPGSAEGLVAIDYPQTFDELVFLASQAFDQNETYHFDLLPAALLRFQTQMTADNIGKLIPAFQRACKIISSDFTSTMGHLDNMLATFFTDYGRLLVEVYPDRTAALKLLRESFREAFDKKELWGKYLSRLDNIKSWNGTLAYKTHRHVLLAAFFLLERKLQLPLLSTPTHQPCWVSPLALVQRLIEYQSAKVLPADVDFQVAVSRCSGEDHQEALILANEKLSGEYRQLISFLLGGEYYPRETLKFKEVWLVAALTRNSPAPVNPQWFAYSSLPEESLTGNFKWTSVIEPFTYKKWDYATRKNIDTAAKRSKLIIEFGDKQAKPSLIKSLFTKLMPAKTGVPQSVYDWATLPYRYIGIEDNDVRRLLFLNPNHPEVWLARIMGAALQSPDFESEAEKRLIINTLEALLTLNKTYGPMAHLLIATAMISSDKTVRAYAAELWISGVNHNTINSQQIGEIIGIHQNIELTPFKRFTDLMLSNLFQVSQAHNQALQTLLNACLSKLGDKPANGLKKLLEIYTEVLAAGKPVVIPAEVLAKLDVWEKVDSMGKTVGKVRLVGGVR